MSPKPLSIPEESINRPATLPEVDARPATLPEVESAFRAWDKAAREAFTRKIAESVAFNREWRKAQGF